MMGRLAASASRTRCTLVTCFVDLPISTRGLVDSPRQPRHSCCQTKHETGWSSGPLSNVKKSMAFARGGSSLVVALAQSRRHTRRACKERSGRLMIHRTSMWQSRRVSCLGLLLSLVAPNEEAPFGRKVLSGKGSGRLIEPSGLHGLPPRGMCTGSDRLLAPG